MNLLISLVDYIRIVGQICAIFIECIVKPSIVKVFLNVDSKINKIV
jgi:hypothetical protein